MKINYTQLEILEMVKNHQILKENGLKLLKTLKKDQESVEPKNSKIQVQHGPVSINDVVDTDIAVIGIAARFPDAEDHRRYWQNIVDGKDSIREIPESRFPVNSYYDVDPEAPNKSYSKWAGLLSDIKGFDPLFFNISPREAEMMDPQQRLFMMETWRAIEDAGYSPSDLSGKLCGVFLGAGIGDYHKILKEKNVPIQAYSFLGNSMPILTARMSYLLNLKGPSVPVDSACSSSLVAIHMAVQSIIDGECDMAISGGVQVFSNPDLIILTSKAGMLSPVGKCKTFAEGADGFVPAEGIGIVILKKLKHALQDGDVVYGIIKGSRMNQDGKSNGITAPSSESQVELECRVYNDLKIHPETIGYIETHGTGTILGDPIEFDALSESYSKYTQKKQYCAIGSVKTNIGHTLVAAGVAGFIKTLLCLKHKTLVPSLHFSEGNPYIDFKNSPFYVNTRLKKWKAENFPRRAAISAFGFSGTNVHMVLEEAVLKKNKKISFPCHVFPLSAKTEKSLKQKIIDLKNWLTIEGENQMIEDIAFTLQVGRDHFDYRVALVCKNITDLKNQLEKTEPHDFKISIPRRNSKKAKDRNEIQLLLQSLTSQQNSSESTCRRIMEKLTTLYMEGEKIPWKSLYVSHRPQRISLPGYPFDCSPFWVPQEFVEKRMILEGVPALHPLLDRNTSTLRQQSFCKHLNEREFFLRDHVIKGNKILPGVCYLEMARAAGELSNEGSMIQSIKNVVWSRPIVLKEIQDSISIVLQPKKDALEYEITGLKKGGQKLVFSQGRLFYQANNSQISSEVLDLVGIKERCRRHVAGEDYYGMLRPIGGYHGPTLQSIKHLYYAEDEVISELECHRDLTTSLHDFRLHPAFMDGAVQTAVGLAYQGYIDQNTLYLPYVLEEITILQSTVSAQYAYAKVSNDQNTEKTSLMKYNLYLLDKAGQVLVRIRNFSIMKYQPDKTANPQQQYDTICCRPEWMETPITSKSSPVENWNLLIFARDVKMVDVYRQMFEMEEQAPYCIWVCPGESFSQPESDVYFINPNQQADYQTLVEQLGRQELIPDKILHLSGESEFSTDKVHVAAQQQILFSLFYIIQAMASTFPKNILDICVLHSEDKNRINPCFAALGGFFRSIYLENSRIFSKSIVMPRQKTRDDIYDIHLVLQEFQDDTRSHIEIQYRENKRFCRLLQEVKQQEELKNDSLLKQKGTYLITGGMSGIGLVTAKYLAKNIQANLFLVGRSELSAYSEKELLDLNRGDSRAVYIRCDISDRNEAKKLMREITRFGQLNGVFHSAGVTRDALVTQKTTQEINEVLAPKVSGTINLDDITRHVKLDLFVLYSSIAAECGGRGQSDYAYANAFLDHFACIREQLQKRGKRFGKTLSINWPLWKEGGMSVDDQTKQLFETTMGMRSIENKLGMEMLQQGLAQENRQFFFIHGITSKIRKYLGLLNSRKHERDVPPQKTKKPAPILDKSSVRESLKEDFVQMISALLKIPKDHVLLDSEMSVFGFDSISFTELANVVNRQYSVDLIPSVFFEYPTPGSFLDFFHDTYLDAVSLYYQQLNKPVEPPLTVDYDQTTKPDVLMENNKTHRFSRNLSLSTEPVSKPDPIVIVGMDGMMPACENLADFWEKIVKKKNLVTEIPADRWNWREYDGDPLQSANKTDVHWGGFIEDLDKFDAEFFGISPREAMMMDPQQRIFLQSVWKALEDAGIKPSDLSNSKTGVYVGVANSDYKELLNSQAQTIEAHMSTGVMSHAIVANRISYQLNLKGPSQPIDTACSSSLVAIHRAVEDLQNEDCDLGIVGGVNAIINPNLYIMFSKAGMLAKDGKCKTFDKDADGYVRGEGVGVLILKKLENAESHGNHIYGIIRGTAENHGGHTNTITTPNPNAQSELLIDVYSKAEIDPTTISYIEAHGTGTSLGDPIEVTGLNKAFKALTQDSDCSVLSQFPYCGIGSVKSNIGHLETASGIAGMIKVLLAMKHKTIPASNHFNQLNPYIKLEGSPFYVVNETQPWEQLTDKNGRPVPRRAGVSSFGFGGTNAHVILEEYNRKNAGKISESISLNLKESPEPTSRKAEETSEPTSRKQVFILSAKNRQSLNDYVNLYINFLAKQPVIKSKIFRNIIYTLQCGREFMDCRLALIVSDPESLISGLTTFLKGTLAEGIFYNSGEENNENVTSDVSPDVSVQQLKDINIQGLAELWVSGRNIPWKKLWEKQSVSFISLPTYPFQKERHWLPAANTKAGQEIELLFGKNKDWEGNRQRHVLTIEDNVLVQDHKVFGNYIVSTDTLMEMIYVGATKYLNTKQVNLNKIFIMFPLICLENRLTLSSIQFEKSNHDIEFVLTSKISDQTGKSRNNVKGFVSALNDVQPRQTRYTKVLECFDTHIQTPFFYREDYPLYAGEFFRTISNIKIHGNEAVGDIFLTEKAKGYKNQLLLNPAVLVGGLGVAVALAVEGSPTEPQETFVPIYINNLNVYETLVEDNYTVYAIRTKATPDFVRLDVQIINKQGKVVVEIEGLDEKKIAMTDIKNSMSYIKSD